MFHYGKFFFFTQESPFYISHSDTSAVQEVEVVQGEECVSVTCYFAAGSNAQGCVVHMTIVIPVNTYTHGNSM